MDESSKLKEALNGHANTLHELSQVNNPAQTASRIAKLLLHILFLGGLLLLGLLKWFWTREPALRRFHMKQRWG